MNKQDFERQRQMLWVHLRDRGRCSVCGQGVDLQDEAIGRAVPRALGIDQLLRIRLVHSRCEAAGRRSEPLAA